MPKVTSKAGATGARLPPPLSPGLLGCQTQGAAGPPLQAEAGHGQPKSGGGLAGWEGGLSPSLAPGLPWLSVLVQVSGAARRFQRHLNILEAICQSWKLFGSSKSYFKVPRTCCICKGYCAWFPEKFEVPAECWGLGKKHAESPGEHWTRSSWQWELPPFSPRTRPGEPPRPSGHLLFCEAEGVWVLAAGGQSLDPSFTGIQAV